jgi:hypothetical protein
MGRHSAGGAIYARPLAWASGLRCRQRRPVASLMPKRLSSLSGNTSNPLGPVGRTFLRNLVRPNVRPVDHRCCLSGLSTRRPDDPHPCDLELASAGDDPLGRRSHEPMRSKRPELAHRREPRRAAEEIAEPPTPRETHFNGYCPS